MRGSSLAPILTLWASAYLGSAGFLLVGLLPRDPITIALIAQLSWLALIGSIPTTLVVGAAFRVARASRTVAAASSAAVIMFVVAIGWEHTDFLLSGPHWMLHPQRPVLRIGMISSLGLLGAGGWLWLILGARSERGLRLAAWISLSMVAIGLLTAAIVRYRAYDYSMAQLIFPAGVLCGAIVYLIVRRSLRWPVVLAAAVCALFGVGARLDPALAMTGQREVIAQSRAGALAILYVLPHVSGEQAWSVTAPPCPEPRPVVEDSPIGIDPGARRNVIIVTVDALRKDVVGIRAVGGRPVTPALSRFAKAGVSFTNATSTYPATLFAMGSAFTGLSPAELYLSASLPETIFTRSRSRVERQFAVLPDVRWFRLPIVEQFLAPGVDIAFAPTDVAATDALLARLRAARDDGASVIAWIHYYSPHDPYQLHPAFPFGKGKKNAYLSEVAFFDRELGRLMRHLEQDGWLDDTLVVFFSDHGEALGEKSYWGHHVYLNSWMIDVPLVLWHAQLSPGEPHVGVSLADVAPTVLHFLGLPIPSDLAAQSLFTLDPNLSNRSSFSEAFPVRGRELFDSFRLPALDDATIRARLRSIRRASKGYEPKGAVTGDRHRLIHHRGADTWLFYDRETDPAERLGRGVSNKASKRLRRDLQQWEQEQLRRIQCRLQLTEYRPATRRPE